MAKTSRTGWRRLRRKDTKMPAAEEAFLGISATDGTKNEAYCTYFCLFQYVLLNTGHLEQ